MIRYAAGDSTRLPYRITRQLVAARLGQLPATVDRMPAGDFMDAANVAGLTGMVTIGGKA